MAERSKHPAGFESSEERFEHGIEDLEGLGTGWKTARRWFLIVASVAAIVVAMYLVRGRREPTRAPRMGQAGVLIIETLEPRGGALGQAPSRFRWESVQGRSDYRFRVLAKGNPKPLVERTVRENSTELTPEEAGRLAAGGSYVWEVEARAADGRTMGAGRSTFGF